MFIPRPVNVDVIAFPAGELESPRTPRPRDPLQPLTLSFMKPARAFLMCTVVAECVVVVPSVVAELHLEDDGPQVAICRICLFAARISLIFVPLVTYLCRQRGERMQRRMDAWLAMWSTACGSVEPSRGIATALAGWYLISTPMHDAFGGDGKKQAEIKEATPELLIPCVVIMAANVFLFLCDALMLTLAPLLRQGEALPEEHEPHHHHHHSLMPVQEYTVAQAFCFGEVVPNPSGEVEKEYSPTCVVCLCDFEQGEHVTRLPCRHMFHTACVSEWLSLRGRCPMRCPGAVLPPPNMPAERRRRRRRPEADSDRASPSRMATMLGQPTYGEGRAARADGGNVPLDESMASSMASSSSLQTENLEREEEDVEYARQILRTAEALQFEEEAEEEAWRGNLGLGLPSAVPVVDDGEDDDLERVFAQARRADRNDGVGGWRSVQAVAGVTGETRQLRTW